MELQKLPPMAIQEEVPLLQSKLSDFLFLQIGVELDDLVRDSAILKLEEDEEYVKMCQEYGEKIEKLQGGQ